MKLQLELPDLWPQRLCCMHEVNDIGSAQEKYIPPRTHIVTSRGPEMACPSEG